MAYVGRGPVGRKGRGRGDLEVRVGRNSFRSVNRRDDVRTRDHRRGVGPGDVYGDPRAGRRGEGKGAVVGVPLRMFGVTTRLVYCLQVIELGVGGRLNPC